MTIERIFLGWDTPFLKAAADFLLKRYASGSSFNLNNVTVVAQVSRANRRLLEILVERAEELEKPLIPPRLVTAGSLPEILITETSPQAGRLQVLLAWMEALKDSPPMVLKRLMPCPPNHDDLAAWSALGEQINSLYTEIAGANLSFAKVAERCRSFDGFNDEERWLALSQVQRRYLEKLSALKLTDQHQWRIDCLQKRKIAASGDLVLLATVDLNAVSRLMLASLNSPVISLIQAPQNEKDAFDEFGCLIAEKWLTRPIEVADEQITIAENPVEQTQALLQFIAGLNTAFSAEQITIGVCNRTLAPYIMQALKAAKLPCRYAAGKPAGTTRTASLLRAVADYLNAGHFSDFATLVRHPDIYEWLQHKLEAARPPRAAERDFLSDLDRYQSEHLPAVTPVKPAGGEKTTAQLYQVTQLAAELLQDLDGERKALKLWAPPIAGFLVKVLGRKDLHRYQEEDRELISSCEILQEILCELNLLEGETPTVTSSQALHFILSNLYGRNIEPQPLESAIELLGWLELPLDDAPVLIITGFNEESIPESINSHPFLPNRLRQALGILDNNRRHARDVWALSAVLHSRPKVQLIAGRRNFAGEPASLSRLLLATDNKKTAGRLLGFYSVSKKHCPQVHKETNSNNIFAGPPKPKPLVTPLLSVPATAFRTYLDCPYRFYLKHVLGLKRLDDSATELDGAAFGTLAHKVLEAFAKSEVANSADGRKIKEFLLEELERVFHARFGRNSLPAIFIQKQQLAARLAAFSQWQACWVQSGWRIVESELVFGPEQLSIDLGEDAPGPPLGVCGRIDRIDYNPAKRCWIIFDYKTSDLVENPEKSHKRGDEWIDLQLPIYYKFWRSKKGSEQIDLAYIALQANPKKTQEYRAKWSETELAEAERCLKETACAIRLEKFWPPKERNRRFDDFAVICGTGLLTSLPVEEAE